MEILQNYVSVNISVASSSSLPLENADTSGPDVIEDEERSHIANLIFTALLLPRITPPPTLLEMVMTSITTPIPQKEETGSSEDMGLKLVETMTTRPPNPTGSTPSFSNDNTTTPTPLMSTDNPTTGGPADPVYVTLPPLTPGSLGGIIREALGLVQNTIRVVGINLLGNQALLGNSPPGLIRINETHFKLVGTRAEEGGNGSAIVRE